MVFLQFPQEMALAPEILLAKRTGRTDLEIDTNKRHTNLRHILYGKHKKGDKQFPVKSCFCRFIPCPYFSSKKHPFKRKNLQGEEMKRQHLVVDFSIVLLYFLLSLFLLSGKLRLEGMKRTE